jgi:hypothetical protein
MGMAQVELVGTEAVYCVDGREVCRMLVSTSGAIEVPPIVFAAMGSNRINLTVSLQSFDRRAEFMTRAERRGKKKIKNSYGPQSKWWNKR